MSELGSLKERDFALMRQSAYLINTSRGPIVDEAALIDALKNNRIPGAGLDVFDIEPLPDTHPLRSISNTVIIPHLGYATMKTIGTVQGTAENVRSVDGKKLTNDVARSNKTRLILEYSFAFLIFLKPLCYETSGFTRDCRIALSRSKNTVFKRCRPMSFLRHIEGLSAKLVEAPTPDS